MRQNDVDAHQEAVVTPAVDMSALENVLVLLNYDPGQLLAEP